MTRVMAITFALLSIAAFAEDEWETYKAPDYGFEMLIPKGAKAVEREKKGGWGGLYVKHDGVEVYALAKLGAAEEKADIRKFAEQECGIAGENWKKIDAGENSKGWKWFEVYVAEKGSTVIFGGFGVGPKGNYLVFLKTTKEDSEEHKADYKEWYGSVKLN